jgi:Cys-rich repeat protein
VPNALVYIPGDPSVALPTLPQGVDPRNPASSCGRCADTKLVADGQTVLASAVTDFTGGFTLAGQIPVGVPFHLVVQIGKWRRVVQVPGTVAKSCMPAALSADLTRLAKNSTDGLAGTQLPKVAISTGQVDAIECVLLGMGIDQAEFSAPGGAGRLQLFQANGSPIGPCTMGRNGLNCPNTVPDSMLWGTQATLNGYDIAIGDCQGSDHPTDFNDQILAYVNAGGRLFASHYAHTWIDGNGALGRSSAWQNDDNRRDAATGDVSLPSGPTMRAGANPTKSVQFVDWLTYQGALNGTRAGQTMPPVLPQFDITNPRDFAGPNVGPSTDEFVYADDSGQVQQLSFDTPYGAAASAICGRVAYSGFHVAGNFDQNNPTSDLAFPMECAGGALTTQEKVLAFQLFDLAACVGMPPVPPACTPKTTCPASAMCGFAPDGCGGVISCGTCPAGANCVAQTCTQSGCTATTDCTGGQVCMAGTCNPCTNATMCATGQLCQNGTCSAGPPLGSCTTPTDCPGGQVCVNKTCAPCSASSQCPGGQLCQNGTCTMPMCMTNMDCPMTQACINGYCGPCTTNTQCGMGFSCNNGSCTPLRPHG